MSLKKQYPWNVLVFPAASEIGLEIHRALRDSKEVVLHGANQPGPSIADFNFKRLYEVPHIHDKDCLPRLKKIVTDHKIDAIFPAHDDVVLWLAEHADQLGATVIGSPLAVAQICRSKRRTYETFKGVIPVPRIWSPSATDIVYPVFVKPDRGQGSQRARVADGRVTLAFFIAKEPDLLVTEHLPGREYTVDCFNRHDRAFIHVQARERMETKSGISILSRPVDLPIAQEWAELIAGKLALRGAWFFQVKEDAKGAPKLLEVAPRIAGSMALSRVTGPNYPLLSIYEAAGATLDIGAFPSDLRMGRSLDVKFIYDKPIDALYFDFDDTVIVHGEVNTRIVALIFQCRNRGIPVKLLTHHQGDLKAALEKHRLTALFDKIIHIPDASVPKASFITEKNAVFVDDSFRERSEATSARGIRCFDAAGAICLLDERR